MSSCERDRSIRVYIHNKPALATAEKRVYVYSNKKGTAAAARDDGLRVFS